MHTRSRTIRTLSCLLTVSAISLATAAPVLNELLVNPVDGDDEREYVEIKAAPGESLDGVTLLEIEGDRDTNRGRVDMARPLDGLSVGTNGLLILGDNYPASCPFPLPAQTAAADLGRAGGSMENQAVTFLLVSGFTGSQGDDLDTDDNGILDVTPWHAVIDGVGWSGGDVSNAVYTDAALTQPSGFPDAATRFPTNHAPNSAAAWYNGDVMRTGIDSYGLTYDANSVSANAPLNAFLTPGEVNFPARRPPIILPTGNQLVMQGDSVSFDILVVPNDGDPVTHLYASDLPPGATFVPQPGNTNGLFNWTSASPSGVYTVTFGAVDIDGTNSLDVTITVQPPPAASRVRINEIFVNPGGADDNREFIEILGIPGAILDGFTFLEIEGDATTGPGRIDAARSLAGLTVGANGLLILGENYSTAPPYPIPADAGVADLNRPGGAMENGSITFLLVTGFTGTAGMDLDLDDDGTMESVPWDSILDGVAWSDGDGGDRLYCPFRLGDNGTPDAASRCGENVDPLSAAAWYFGEVTTTIVDTVGITYDPAASSSNLPPGAALTPGYHNMSCGPGFADLDGDGMGDRWEMDNDLTVGVDDSDGDPDNDDIPNVDEWIMDTRADTSNAMLRVTWMAGAASNISVTFGPSSTARVYTLQYRGQLFGGQAWSNAAGFVDLPGEASQSFLDGIPAGPPVRFYRVKVHYP